MNIVINKHHRYHFLDIRTRQKAKTEKQQQQQQHKINPTPTQNTHINRHIVKCLRDNIVSYTVFDIMLIKLF